MREKIGLFFNIEDLDIFHKLEEYFHNVQEHVRIESIDISSVFLDQLPKLLKLDQPIVNDDVYRTRKKNK